MPEPIFTWSFNIAEPPAVNFINFLTGVNNDKFVFAETGGIEIDHPTIEGIEIPQVSAKWAPELYMTKITALTTIVASYP